MAKRPAKKLVWDMNYDDRWNASACIGDDGGSFKFDIALTSDGKFSVADSAAELALSDYGVFDTFADAVNVCDVTNRSIFNSLKKG